jgi:hypothetical protein
MRLALLLIPLAGCLRAKSFEGDIRGECGDGADNDRDGAFDCEDPDCEGSVECAPEGPPPVDPDPAPVDADGDGYAGDRDADPRDCDDEDAAVNPGAEELPYTGVDEDCDPATPDDDLDGDGVGVAEDCDDADPEVRPGAAELPYSGVDEDCDPATPDDDLDGDGVGVDADCDEGDPAVGAGAAAACGHPARAAFAVFPEAAGMELGSALRMAGDLDGDGAPDLLLGARGAGRGAGAVYLVSGAELAAAGPGGLSTAGLPAPWTGGARFDYLGEGDRLRALPDLDGDGAAELLIGSPNADPGGYANAGEVYLISAAAAGGEAGAAAGLRVQGRAAADKLGQALEAADLDGDGLPELLVSSPQDDEGATNAGALFVFSGDALAAALAGGAGTLAPADADGALTGAFQQAIGFGALSTGLDATGDGLPDLLLGASDADAPGAVDAGLALLLPGGAALLTRRAAAGAAVATATGLAYDDQLGSSGLLLPDRDGDGVAELLVGAVQGDGAVSNAGALWLWSGGPGLAGALSPAGADLSWAGDVGLSRAGSALAPMDGPGGPWLLAGSPYAASGGQAHALPLAGAWAGGALGDDAALWLRSGAPDALGAAVAGGELGGAPAALVGAPAAGELAGGVFGFPVL